MNMLEQSVLRIKEDYKLLELKPDQIYTFSEGIPGFERIKQYCLLQKQGEDNIFHLAALGGFNLEFIVVNPWVVLPSYNPEISDEDIRYLGSPGSKELILLAIAVITEPIENSTVNLAAPIIINTKTGAGRQIVIRNFNEHSSQHPLIKKEQMPRRAEDVSFDKEAGRKH